MQLRTLVAPGVLAALLSPALAGGTALARAPGNDAFAHAKPIKVNSLTLGTTVGATRERFEPWLGSGGSVWYRFVARRTGDISMNTCSTRNDIVLGAFEGRELKSLKKMATDDDGCPRRGGYFGSHVRFAAVSGTTYRVGIGAYSGKGGRFNLVVTSVGPPPNDSFAKALGMTPGRSLIGSNVIATREPGEPRHGGNSAGHSLWFKVKAPTSGKLIAATFGSSFDTIAAVYRGSRLAGAQRVAFNDDANRRTIASQVTWNARKGVTYRIVVDGAQSSRAPETGDAVLTLTRARPVRAAAARRPGNDMVKKARPVAINSRTLGTTIGATRERFEPYLGSGGSVWYRVRASRTGVLAVNTCSSRSDLVLGAFTGSSTKALKRIGGNEGGCPGRGWVGSRLRFDVQAGITYRIGVGTYYKDAKRAGRFNLVVAAVQAYPNDLFSGARGMRIGQTLIESNEVATPEPGEPDHAGRPPSWSLWFTFKAPRSGKVRVSTDGSSFDTVLAVYKGNSLSALTRVGFNDDANRRTIASQVVWRATAGTTYRIALDGFKSAHAPGSGDAVVTLSRAR